MSYEAAFSLLAEAILCEQEGDHGGARDALRELAVGFAQSSAPVPATCRRFASLLDGEA